MVRARWYDGESLDEEAQLLNPTTEHLHKVIAQIEEARQKTATLAGSLQAKSEPAEQTPAHDETQPEAKSLVS
jgi:hypothetical protein